MEISGDGVVPHFPIISLTYSGHTQAGLDLHMTWSLIIRGGQHSCLSCVRNCVCARIWDHGEERRDGHLGN